MEADGTLVGIVTEANLVRAFARAEEEIEREIRSEIIEHPLLIDAGRVDVRVEQR